MLNPTNPLSLVAGAISPVHLSVPVPLVILVLAFVNVSTGPCKLAKAAFVVVDVVAFVDVALRPPTTAQFALSFLHAASEVAYVGRPSLPGVLTFAVWLAIYVLTCV